MLENKLHERNHSCQIMKHVNVVDSLKYETDRSAQDKLWKILDFGPLN